MKSIPKGWIQEDVHARDVFQQKYITPREKRVFITSKQGKKVHKNKMRGVDL